MALLTEHDINSVRFNAPSDISTGYDQDEVDVFLDKVAETIAKLTRNGGFTGAGGGLLTERDIVNMNFNEPSSIQTGYDQDEVDVFLDEAAETIAFLTNGNSNTGNVNVTLETINELKNENINLENRLKAAESRVSELQGTGTMSKNSSAISEDAGDAFGKAPGLFARLKKLF